MKKRINETRNGRNILEGIKEVLKNRKMERNIERKKIWKDADDKRRNKKNWQLKERKKEKGKREEMKEMQGRIKMDKIKARKELDVERNKQWEKNVT